MNKKIQLIAGLVVFAAGMVLALKYPVTKVFADGAYSKFETNIVVDVVTANDATNSTQGFVAIGNQVPQKFYVKTPSNGAVTWGLTASAIATGVVANVGAIPASTYQEIDLSDGCAGVIHFRFQSQTTDSAVGDLMQVKVIGYNN